MRTSSAETAPVHTAPSTPNILAWLELKIVHQAEQLASKT